jgi:hypothetical protein
VSFGIHIARWSYNSPHLQASFHNNEGGVAFSVMVLQCVGAAGMEQIPVSRIIHIIQNEGIVSNDVAEAGAGSASVIKSSVQE